MPFTETGTTVTWKNPEIVPEAKRAEGGWYYNPASGSVDRWFNQTQSSGQSSAPTSSYQAPARKSSEDVYNELSTQYGLGDLKNTAKSLSEQIYKIEDYLKGVESDVQTRGGDFLMNDAQQRRLIAAESEPSQKNLASLGTDYGRVTSNISSITNDINTRLNLVMADQKYQDDIRSAAANVGVSITGNESTEELLSAIASKVNENDVWEKAFKEKQLAKSGSSGTATERATADSLTRLRADIAAGVPYYELGPRYMSELPLSQIRQEYNSGPLAKSEGAAKETAKDEAMWSVKPKSESSGGINWQLPDGTIVNIP